MLRVLPEKNKIVVEGVNRVYKHLKPSAKNQQGGRLSKEMPIDVSNVMLYCPTCNRGVRVGHRFTDAGQKQRYCKVCSASLGNVGPAKPAHAVEEDRRLSRTLNVAAARRRDGEGRSEMARLLDQYNTTIAPGWHEVQPDQQDGDPQAGEDRHQHGRRPGHPGQGAARGGRRQPEQDQRPEAAWSPRPRSRSSGFRLREGNEIGCKVTLRGKRMYEFLDRLISIALPRIRDFRGVNPNSFDGHGNYTLGLAEQVVFPEIDADRLQHTQGMDITIVTTTKNDDQARELLRGVRHAVPPARAGAAPGQDEGPTRSIDPRYRIW